MATVPGIQQVSVPLSNEQQRIVAASEVSRQRLGDDYARLQAKIEDGSDGGLNLGFYKRIPPFNLCITSEFADHIRETHAILNKVLVDLIGRWHSDVTMRFPERMPLEEHETRLLAWMDGNGKKYVGKYGHRSIGIWRSDFVIAKQNNLERIKLIELNARIPFNGLHAVGLNEVAVQSLVDGQNALQPLNDYDNTMRTILRPFDGTKPLYLIRDMWPGVDSPLVLRDFQRISGSTTRTVKPSHLRTRKEEDSLRLCFEEDGELIDIDQCCCELFQEELNLDEEVLKALASVCRINDLRTLLLVHDKRILGIIKEEIPDLASRKIITSHEARILQDGILDTLFPGDLKLRAVLEESRCDAMLKDGYIIKPVRDASGHGIKFGKNISQDEWLTMLEDQCHHALLPSEGAVVVQKLNNHEWYDLSFIEHERKQVNFVGSQHMLHGELQAFGPWRTAVDTNLPMMGDVQGIKGMLMTCVLRPEGW
ncbi:MAG: hypothetical protein LQ340_002150 [Diploschistes diacapsis]|nr:MAG: hypothetical protein LQ340_002150 [Diploschistes diacapsis]